MAFYRQEKKSKHRNSEKCKWLRTTSNKDQMYFSHSRIIRLNLQSQHPLSSIWKHNWCRYLSKHLHIYITRNTFNFICCTCVFVKHFVKITSFILLWPRDRRKTEEEQNKTKNNLPWQQCAIIWLPLIIHTLNQYTKIP